MMAKRVVQQTMLGNWLREARGERSQTDVAARIGMEQAEWSRWERGERKRPNPEQIRDFATALSVPVETVALAYAGIWPGSSALTEMPDDPVQIIEQIAALTDRLDRVMRADRESRVRRQNAAS
jgi:transcriptional regulator with XRE-family HTH domain